MATAAQSLQPDRKPRPKRRARLVLVDHRGEKLGQEHLLAQTRRFRSQQERRHMVEAMARRPGPNDAFSVRLAMQWVEARIVKGLWVLEISSDTDGPQQARQHGLGYMPEPIDIYAQAVAKGGYEPLPPRPAVPSSKEIDAAKEAKKWIELLDEGQARLLTVAAMSKRGDRLRRVNWDWVKSRLRIADSASLRTLQDRYDRALRWIVAELSVAATK